MQRVFEFEKTTKNTVRFQEVVDDSQEAIIRTIYLQKTAYKELKEPKAIQVTIQAI